MNIIDENDLPFSFGILKKCNYIWLTLTNLCNIHCKYCFNYLSRNNEYMPASTATKIIDSQIKNLDLDANESFNICYFGGEPTLNKEALLACIDYLTKNDIYGHQYLMTNGIMNEHTLAKLLHRNIQFQISFDGEQNNLRFDKKMRHPVLDKTIDTIKGLVQEKEHVTIRGTIHQDNINNMSDIVRFCDQYQVRYLKLAPICEFGDAQIYNVKQPDLKTYIYNYCQARDLAKQYGVQIETLGFTYLSQWKKEKLNIPLVWLPDGKVAMTITYSSSKTKGAETTIIGNLNEHGHIELDEKKVNLMKHNFLRNRERYCSHCPIRNICCGNIHFTPFATDTFVPERDSYFCKFAIEMVEQRRES